MTLETGGITALATMGLFLPKNTDPGIANVDTPVTYYANGSLLTGTSTASGAPTPHYTETWQYGAIPGTFRAVTDGGYVDQDTTTLLLGRNHSFKHFCSSAATWDFRQKRYTVRAGKSITIEFALYDPNGLATTPQAFIIDPDNDPMNDVLDSPLAQLAAGVSGRLTWANTNTYDYEIIARVQGKDAVKTYWENFEKDFVLLGRRTRFAYAQE